MSYFRYCGAGGYPPACCGLSPFRFQGAHEACHGFAKMAASNNVSRRCSSSSYCNDNTCRATLQIYFAEGSHRLKFLCPLSVSVTSRVRCGCCRHSRTSHRFGRSGPSILSSVVFRCASRAQKPSHLMSSLNVTKG